MRKQLGFRSRTLLVLLIALALAPVASAASSPTNEFDELPTCSDMTEAQVPGKDPGSACRVPIVRVLGPETGITVLDFYRSGWTHTHTSESDSDLTEDYIKVSGYFYWKYNPGDNWILGDPENNVPCKDEDDFASHVACRTYGDSGNYFKQDGYHYFRTAGYQDENFKTTDLW